MLANAILSGDSKMKELKPKRVKVSKQRQISIPKEYYEKLNFEDEAIVELTDLGIIVRPAKTENVDLSEYILKDLIKMGYKEDELLNKFIEIKRNLPTTIDKLTEETLETKPMTPDMSLDEFLDEVEDE